jgi:ribosomal protein S20
MLEIKTLEEALTHIEMLKEENKALKAALKTAEIAKEDAEAIAQDAIKKANETLSAAPKDLTVTVSKKKYKIAFAVDGLTKEELAQNGAKCAELVKKGSAALELQED